MPLSQGEIWIGLSFADRYICRNLSTYIKLVNTSLLNIFLYLLISVLSDLQAIRTSPLYICERGRVKNLAEVLFLLYCKLYVHKHEGYYAASSAGLAFGGAARLLVLAGGGRGLELLGLGAVAELLPLLRLGLLLFNPASSSLLRMLFRSRSP